MIYDIKPEHFAHILRINEEFVYWLSPMDDDELKYVLSLATYKRQIAKGKGVLIGYPHDVAYPEHKNLRWLRQHTKDFFYIDRIIIDADVQGQGYGQLLYNDIENFARLRGYKALVCEVNTKPNNPISHKFHKAFGFKIIGNQDYPAWKKAVRYYEKML